MSTHFKGCSGSKKGGDHSTNTTCQHILREVVVVKKGGGHSTNTTCQHILREVVVVKKVGATAQTLHVSTF